MTALHTFIFLLVFAFTSSSYAISYGYKVQNPENPNQDIMLIGSLHFYPLRKLPVNLVKEMKSKDMIIAEQNFSQTWSDRKRLKQAFLLTKQMVTNFETNLLSNAPIQILDYTWIQWFEKLLMEGPEEVRLNKTDAKKYYSSYLKMLHDLLKTFSGDETARINPRAILFIFQNYLEMTMKKFGMDFILSKHYKNSNKMVLPLETINEVNAGELTLAPIVQQDTNRGSIEDTTDMLFQSFRVYLASLNFGKGSSTDALHMAIELQVLSPKMIGAYEITGITGSLGGLSKEISENPHTVLRNHKWIIKFKKYLQDNPDKSMVVIVGAAHLIGDQSFKKLLEAEGFTFEALDH